MAERLLAKNLCFGFGGLRVTRDVCLSLKAGARTALIGPNGAGKTTLVNLLSGALTPTSGTIHLDGEPVGNLSQSSRARVGIARTFQVSRLFGELSVRDNLRIAVLQRNRASISFWLPPVQTKQIASEIDHVLTALDLYSVADKNVATLSLGEQRIVEVGLALALKPRVLLLDEPGAGVPPGENRRILQAVDQLPNDLAVLLIEHDMDMVFRFAKEIVVLVAGSVMIQGSPREIAQSPLVKDIYFGSAHG